MSALITIQPVDYLVIGHFSIDIIGNERRVGGTAAYAALTAQSLGLRVGVVSAWGNEIPLDQLQTIPFVNISNDGSTTFQMNYEQQGRSLVVQQVAPSIEYYHIPEAWRDAPIVHLAPVAQEVEPSLVRNFPSALLCVTPQGWLRSWDANGNVIPSEWPEASFVLGRIGAAVVSSDDLDGDEGRIEEFAASSRVMALTEGRAGVRVYWNGDVRRFKPPQVRELDATGAGDVFATAFFARLYSTRDPWEAARFASQLAAISVTRIGLDSIPTKEEILDSMIEVF